MKTSEKRKRGKKEEAGAQIGRKVAIHCIFPMICGSGGSKSRLAKVAGAEPWRQMRDLKLHAAVARSAFPSQKVQSTRFSDHLWKLRCRKNVSPSQKYKKRTGSDHFLMFSCRKSVSRCGAKHISKSKGKKKTEGFSGHFLTLRCRKTVVARGRFPSQKCKN